MDKIDLQALHLNGTYCHKTGIRPPSCQTPRQPTIYGASEKRSFTKVAHDFSLSPRAENCGTLERIN